MALVLPIPQMGEMVVVLTPDNLERMQKGDPFTIHLNDYGFSAKIRVTVCYEQDAERVTNYVLRGEVKKAIDYLHRGWEHREGEDAIPPKKVSQGSA